MSDSRNKKTAIKNIRRGLSIYKTGRSPFWHARIYDPVRGRYSVRSTKERHRLQAIEVAEEIHQDMRESQNSMMAKTKETSFEYYALMLDRLEQVRSKGIRNKYAYSDLRKILYREEDGILSDFGKFDITKITSGNVRDYLHFLDLRRDKPLAMSTKSKQCAVIRRVMMLALEDVMNVRLPECEEQPTRPRS